MGKAWACEYQLLAPSARLGSDRGKSGGFELWPRIGIHSQGAATKAQPHMLTGAAPSSCWLKGTQKSRKLTITSTHDAQPKPPVQLLPLRREHAARQAWHAETV